MSDLDRNLLMRLEAAAAELAAAFNIQSPPIPIESILQNPKPDMWEEVDIAQLSGTFLSIKDHYSPRMSLARLLARHVVTSSWAQVRGIPNIVADEPLIRTFARMLIMPAGMVDALSAGARNPTAMSMHFEVPEEDARLRIQELAE